MANEALERVWLQVRDELRRQRGRNKFRGGEIHLLPQRLIRIPVEHREGTLHNSELVIQLSEVEAELSALLVPEGKHFHIRDYEFRLAGFIDALLAEVRGGEYLVTNSKTASYRKVKRKGEN